MSDTGESNFCNPKRQSLADSGSARPSHGSRNEEKLPPSRPPNKGQPQQGLLSPLFLKDFPSEAIQHVVSFLEYQDRQVLTFTSKRGLEEIEKFSARVYTKLKEEHGVDSSFDERVCDQSDISTEITGRAKPVPIPYRCRVRFSLQKYLYKIEMGNIGGSGVLEDTNLLLSPSGHRLAVAMLVPGDLTRIFDFSTKRLTTLEHNGACSLDSILLDDNRVITWSHGGILKIWTEDSQSGQWNHETLAQFDNLIEDVEPEHQNVCHEGETFTMRWNPATSLLESIAISVEDGSVNAQLEIDDFSICWRAFVARDGNQKWQVIFGVVKENGVMNRGLFIYNMNSPGDRQRLLGCGKGFPTLEDCRVVQASDCSKTFFACGRTNTNQHLVAMLDFGADGLIAERFSFPVLGSRIVAASKTKVLVENNNMVDLYYVSATTRRPMRSYGPFNFEDRIPGVVHATRNEFLTVDDQGNLLAFCLKEPHL